MIRKNETPVSPARRLVVWTTNLLVTGVVILLGITVGRTVLYWWVPAESRLPPRSVAEQFLGPDAFAGEEEPHDLRFGDVPLLFRRRLFRGPFDELLDELRTQTIDLVAWSNPLPDELGPGESRILNGLAGKDPIATASGIWEAFEEPVPLPMVVVVSAGSSTGDVGDGARRVLSWGMAFPRGDSTGNEWTIFACCRSDDSGLRTGILDEFPLPRGCRRVMSLGNAAGAALVSFQGVGPLQEWTRFYSEWCLGHDWNVDSTWQDLNRGSSARFVNRQGIRVDVEIVIDRNQLRGLLSVVPPVVSSVVPPMNLPTPPLENESKPEQEDT